MKRKITLNYFRLNSRKEFLFANLWYFILLLESYLSNINTQFTNFVNNITKKYIDIIFSFFQFVIAGPSTDTTITHYTSFGVPVGENTANRRAQTRIGTYVFILFT